MFGWFKRKPAASAAAPAPVPDEAPAPEPAPAPAPAAKATAPAYPGQSFVADEPIAGAAPGTAGPLILDELDRSDADLEVIKKRYSMFFQTGLDALLRQLGTDQIILAGVNTHACIRVAAIDAYQRDFEVVIVRECVASKDAHHHDVTMDYLDGGVARLVTLNEVKEQFFERRAG